MNIDGLDSDYGLAKVGYDRARYIVHLQEFFDINVNFARDLREALYCGMHDKACRLTLNLKECSDLVGGHVIAGKAEALTVALRQGTGSMIEHQIDGLETELRHLLEDIRWYL